MQEKTIDVSEIIQILPYYEGCKFCDEKKLDNMEKTVNHYIQKHGYKLLYLGPETFMHGNEDKTITTAVLGK